MLIHKVRLRLLGRLTACLHLHPGERRRSAECEKVSQLLQQANDDLRQASESEGALQAAAVRSEKRERALHEKLDASMQEASALRTERDGLERQARDLQDKLEAGWQEVKELGDKVRTGGCLLPAIGCWSLALTVMDTRGRAGGRAARAGAALS